MPPTHLVISGHEQFRVKVSTQLKTRHGQTSVLTQRIECFGQQNKFNHMRRRRLSSRGLHHWYTLFSILYGDFCLSPGL
mgnify:CR=1 FL=1